MTGRKPLHPIFLKLAGEPVLVVGGGAVAERKVDRLIESGARVTVVSPTATPRLRARAAAGDLAWHARPYQQADVLRARLVYVATGDAAVNRGARDDALAAGVWVNVADEPDLCDFFAPAVVRQGELTIAISTAGASPALASRIRRALERQFGPEYAEALGELRAIRERARREGRPIGDWQEEIEAILARLLPP